MARFAACLISVFVMGIGAAGDVFAQPPATLDSAVTRDADGNGYLDRIEMYFSAPVTFTADFPLSNITVTSAGTLFSVDSVGVRGVPGVTFVLYLHQDSLSGILQTAWTPLVSISGLAGAAAISSFQSKDGAGPVIANVVKTIANLSDRTSDFIRVTFSEPVQGANGTQFTKAIYPEYVFSAWGRRTTSLGMDTLVELLGEFTGISEFFQVENNGSSVSYYMSNAKDLLDDNYISINADSHLLYDRPAAGGVGVTPVLGNRKVQVTVISNAALNQIIVVPNPSRPICTRERPGVFHFADNPNARNWVRQDGAGVVVTFKSLNSTSEKSLAGLKFFDSFGSIVASAESANGIYLGSVNAALGSVTDVDIYWNGTDTRGNYVHEGTYVAELNYMPPGKSDPVVLQQTFYMEKPENAHSICGGGFAVAFIPAIGFRLRRCLRFNLIKLFRRRP